MSILSDFCAGVAAGLLLAMVCEQFYFKNVAWPWENYALGVIVVIGNLCLAVWL